MADNQDRENKPTYKVAAPYVTILHKDRNGSDLISGFYAGAPVPDTADEATVQRLLEKDMLVRADDPIADIIAVPAGTPIPGEPPNVPVPEVPTSSHDDRMARARELVGRGTAKKRDDASPAAPSGKSATVEPPAASDPKATWVDYAVTQGEDRVKAEGSSKEQLVGKYGKR